MIFTYFKIWLKVIKKDISLKILSRIVLEYLAYVAVTYMFISRNIILLILVSLLFFSIRLAIQLVYFYKKIVETNDYSLILLKPVDPLFGLLIYNRNAADIIILLPILIYIKIKNYKKLNNI